MNPFDNQNNRDKENWSSLNEIKRSHERKKDSWKMVSLKIEQMESSPQRWKVILHPAFIGPAVVILFFLLVFPAALPYFTNSSMDEATSGETYFDDTSFEDLEKEKDDVESAYGFSNEELEPQVLSLIRLVTEARKNEKNLPEFFDQLREFAWEDAAESYSEETKAIVDLITGLDDETKKAYLDIIIQSIQYNSNLSKDVKSLLYHMFMLYPEDFIREASILAEDSNSPFYYVIDHAKETQTLGEVKNRLEDLVILGRNEIVRREWNNYMSAVQYEQYHGTSIEEIILVKSEEVIQLLSSKNYDKLGELVDEQKGLTISPSTDFEIEFTFSQGEISQLQQLKTQLTWGEIDGVTQVLTPDQFLESYFVRKIFENVSFNRSTIQEDKTLNTMYEKFPNSLYVELLPQENTDGSLHHVQLVFEERKGDWVLVALVMDGK